MLANNLSRIFLIGLLRLFDSSAQIPITWRGLPELEPDNLVGEVGALIGDVLLLSILLGSRLRIKLYAGV